MNNEIIINEHNQFDNKANNLKNNLIWHLDKIKMSITFQGIVLCFLIVISFLMKYLWKIIIDNNPITAPDGNYYTHILKLHNDWGLVLLIFLIFFCFTYYLINIKIISRVLAIDWQRD